MNHKHAMGNIPTVTSVSIRVKFFASLRERMGRGEARMQVPAGSSVRTVWQQAAGAETVPGQVLVAVNMHYVDWRQTVDEGDEVAFFPPVTGG
jgi:molybdopterin synthase sulfur carrier subunit